MSAMSEMLRNAQTVQGNAQTKRQWDSFQDDIKIDESNFQKKQQKESDYFHAASNLLNMGGNKLKEFKKVKEWAGKKDTPFEGPNFLDMINPWNKNDYTRTKDGKTTDYSHKDMTKIMNFSQGMEAAGVQIPFEDMANISTSDTPYAGLLGYFRKQKLDELQNMQTKVEPESLSEEELQQLLDYKLNNQGIDL